MSARAKRRPVDGRSGRVRNASAIVALASALVACGGGDRPATDEWTAAWQRTLAIVPTADEVGDEGRDLCDQRLGDLRVALDELTPTPDPALDAAVESWSDAALGFVFDCPTSGAEVRDRLDELGTLGAEIDAGLRTRRD